MLPRLTKPGCWLASVLPNPPGPDAAAAAAAAADDADDDDDAAPFPLFCVIAQSLERWRDCSGDWNGSSSNGCAQCYLFIMHDRHW